MTLLSSRWFRIDVCAVLGLEGVEFPFPSLGHAGPWGNARAFGVVDVATELILTFDDSKGYRRQYQFAPRNGIRSFFSRSSGLFCDRDVVFVPVRFVDSDFESLLGFRRFREALEDDGRRVSCRFNFGFFYAASGRYFAFPIFGFEFR